MAPNSCSTTPQQITVLLDFLDEHKDLARGRLRNIEGKVQAKRLWEELCDTLNSMGGCTKTIQQWQKPYDLRGPDPEEYDLLQTSEAGCISMKMGLQWDPHIKALSSRFRIQQRWKYLYTPKKSCTRHNIQSLAKSF